MYAATLDTTHYTFQASGSLWQDALVLQDLQTESLWSHVSGEAIMGPKEGAALELFPSQQMSFAEFKGQFPDGLLLSKPSRGMPNSNYQEYYEDPSKLGIFGRIDKYRKLRGKDKVIGVRIGKRQAAVSLKLLKRKKAVTIKEMDPPVIITYDDSSEAISAFSTEMIPIEFRDDLELASGLLLIKKSELSYNPITGAVVTGDGSNLKTVPFTTAYWFAWISFFPETKLMK